MKLNTTGFRVARPEKLSSKDVEVNILIYTMEAKKIQIKKTIHDLVPNRWNVKKLHIKNLPGSHKFKHPLSSISKQKNISQWF